MANFLGDSRVDIVQYKNFFTVCPKANIHIWQEARQLIAGLVESAVHTEFPTAIISVNGVVGDNWGQDMTPVERFDKYPYFEVRVELSRNDAIRLRLSDFLVQLGQALAPY